MDSKMKVENLDLYYGKFKALKNINLDLPQNEITAFIGPSGCGKSTLLKSLNRMNDLVEGCKITGKVTLDGEDIYGDMDVNLLRKRVGMVFQKPNPISTSKIEDLAVELKSKYTIIMVTHNMQQAVRISDNTAFFLLGEMVEYGRSEQLFSMPQDKRTEDYITGRFG